MERWAKAQNKRNESGKGVGDVASAAMEGAAGTGAADAAFAVLLERRGAAPPENKALTLKMQLKKDPPPPVSSQLRVMDELGCE